LAQRLGQQQTGCRSGGGDSPTATVLHDRFVVRWQIKPEQGKPKSTTSLKRSMTLAGVAPRFGEHGCNVSRKVNDRWRQLGRLKRIR
jgi:hypothetical protein